jgi:hypothetical protein
MILLWLTTCDCIASLLALTGLVLANGFVVLLNGKLEPNKPSEKFVDWPELPFAPF